MIQRPKLAPLTGRSLLRSCRANTSRNQRTASNLRTSRTADSQAWEQATGHTEHLAFPKGWSAVQVQGWQPETGEQHALVVYPMEAEATPSRLEQPCGC